MSKIDQDTFDRFSEIQSLLWENCAASASSEFGCPISFQAPLTIITKPEDVSNELHGPNLMIQFAFEQNPSNTQLLLIPTDLVKCLLKSLTGNDVEDLTDEIIEPYKEKFASLAFDLINKISDLIGEKIMPSSISPIYQIFNLPANLQQSNEIVRVQVGLFTENYSGSITWLLDSDSLSTIIKPEDALESNGSDRNVIEFSGKKSVPSNEERDLAILLDIPLEISVELGRVKMFVKDVIELTSGSVIELEKAAGEPIDVLVNGRIVARGEVVVIEDNFGIRITEVLSPKDRIAQLGEAA